MRLYVVCPSVRPSVTFTYRDHIGWNTLKIISRPNSLRSLLTLTLTWAIRNIHESRMTSGLMTHQSRTCFRDVDKLFSPGALHDAVDLDISRVGGALSAVAELFVRVGGSHSPVQDHRGLRHPLDIGQRSRSNWQGTSFCRRASITDSQRQESSCDYQEHLPWWSKSNHSLEHN